MEKIINRKNKQDQILKVSGKNIQIKFFEPVSLSILSSSRVVRPTGLDGGLNGLAGMNFHIDEAGRHNELPGCAQIEIKPGESVLIHTPGGGGFGEPFFD